MLLSVRVQPFVEPDGSVCPPLGVDSKPSATHVVSKSLDWRRRFSLERCFEPSHTLAELALVNVARGSMRPPLAKSAIRTALEVSPDAEGLVQADVGTSPNEIPLNGFLGRQAYAETPMVPVPASATAPGVQGEIAADASYVYVCTAKDTWKRAAVATW